MYKINVEHRYQNGDELKFEFTSKSGLYIEASREVDAEVITRRAEQKKNPFERASYTHVSLSPIKT